MDTYEIVMRDKLDALEALVKELAESEPYQGDDAFEYCHYCKADREVSDYIDVTEHADDCLWMRAKALVQ